MGKLTLPAMKWELAIVAAAVMTASCNDAADPGSDARICATPPKEIAHGAWSDCIHKWSYRLARSPDPAKVVAEAAVNACSDAIAWQINNYDKEPGYGAAGEVGREALGAAIMRSAPQEALFRVVQARAGNCEVP